jgi:hypothetical protein
MCSCRQFGTQLSVVKIALFQADHILAGNMVVFRADIHHSDPNASGGWITQIVERQDIQTPAFEADEAGLAHTPIRRLREEKSDRTLPQGASVVDIKGDGLGTA